MSGVKSQTYSPLDGEDGKPDYNNAAANHVGTTFGVEIEFSLASLEPGIDDPHADDERTVTFLGKDEEYTDMLSKAQVSIRDAINERLGTNQAYISYADNYDHPELSWIVSHDTSVSGPLGCPYTWVSIETQSPAFQFCEASLLEVQTVCRMLNNKYRILADNQTASVHCHIGFGRRSYTIDEIRSLFSIWWVFEPQFYKLVAKHRHTNSFCKSVRKTSFLSLEKASDKKTGIGDGLTAIIETNDFNELVRLFSHAFGGRLGFNIQNLHGWSTKDTIEFRMHEDSTQPDEIIQWISFCTNLVVFATIVKPEKLYPWLDSHVDDTEDSYSIGDLLRALRMPEQAAWFEKKIDRMEAEAEDGSLASSKPSLI